MFEKYSVVQKERNTLKNLLFSNWFPLVVEMRTNFKRRSSGKIKGSCTIRCILDVQMIHSYWVINF